MAREPNRRNDAGPVYHSLGTPESPSLISAEHGGSYRPVGTIKRKLVKNRRSREIKHRSLLAEWKLELLACLAFLTALGAMVATMYPHQGKPLPQWPFRISVNTLLAIYGTVMKITIVYVAGSCVAQLQWSWFSSERPLIDLSRLADLSHGDIPGAFRWLWSNHIRQPLITIGAVVVISSVALEPFIQQLTSYVDCSVPLENGVPTIPRTNYIVQRTNVFSAQSGDPDITSAILAGLVGSPDPLKSSGCTTGNCTFSTTYTSAGICSVCEDISKNVTVAKTCRRADGSAIDCADASYEESVVWADRVTSSGSYDGVNLMNVSWTPMRNESDIFHVGTTFYPQWPRYIMFGIQVIWGETSYSQAKVSPISLKPVQGCDDPSTNNTWACRGSGSAYCKLRLCARTYNASVDAGVLKEKVIEESPVSTKDMVPPPPEAIKNSLTATLGLLDLKCVNDVELRELRKIGYNISSSSPRWAAYVVDNDLFQLGNDKYNNIGPDSPFPFSLLSHGCLYMMSLITQTNWFYIAGALSGNVSASCIQNGCTNTSSEADPDIRPLPMLSGEGPPIVLYNNSQVNFESLSEKFSQVATHMTTVLRQNGNVNFSKPAKGVEYHYATCLNVHWIWIILPAVVCGCVMALLATVAILTAYDGTPVWKGNILAFIFHGPGGSDWSSKPEPSELLTTEGMEQRAREMKVILDQSSNSAQLLEVKQME